MRSLCQRPVVALGEADAWITPRNGASDAHVENAVQRGAIASLPLPQKEWQRLGRARWLLRSPSEPPLSHPAFPTELAD